MSKSDLGDPPANSEVAAVAEPPRKDPQIWRDLVAFWFLGLCNNYGYVVMLSAAHDILESFNEPHQGTRADVSDGSNDRMCNLISTGAILLADIIPSMVIKALAPFLPWFIQIRALTAMILQVIGFLMVAFAGDVGQWLAILGVILTSLSSGLGEVSFLAYSARFDKNVVSTWSSGTGGAGVIGSVSYAGLIAAGLSSQDTMLVMIVVPVIEAVAFWFVLRKPSKPEILETTMSSTETIVRDKSGVTSAEGPTDDLENSQELSEEERPLVGLKNKMKYIPKLFKYMIPLTLVYFLEYLINQGLFELVYFDNIFLTKAEQYRWLQVDYQLGVFVSRSSVNLVTIDKIWIMSVFQALNVAIFLCEVMLYFMPSIWIIFAIVFWEGLLGGGAYVNTFYRMSKELPEARKNFALSVVPLGDTVGIALAGACAIPLHNALCMLPKPIRL